MLLGAMYMPFNVTSDYSVKLCQVYVLSWAGVGDDGP